MRMVTLMWGLFFSKILFSLLFFVYGQSPESFYRYKKVLDPDGAYELFWNINDTDIHLEVRVRTLGYIGLGISKDGKMSPADMVIGWVQDNNVYFGDYHTMPDSRTPVYDASQDWVIRSRPGLTFASEVDGYTSIAFERKLDTCDENDEVISGDTMQIIYSYHPNDPDVTTGMFDYHGLDKRGTKYILFKDHNQEPSEFPLPGSFLLPLQIYNYTIPKQLYTRQCLVYNVTDAIPPNSHLVMYEPIIDPANLPYVYRMVLYRCNIDQPALVNNRFDCTDGGPSVVKSCTNMVATWSMGAERFYFPEGTGIPLSGPANPTMYVLHIHYTNPTNDTGKVDYSGLNLMYTTIPLPNEAAFLTLGSVLSSNLRQLVPPGEHKYTTSTICSRRCLRWGFGNISSPIQALGVIFNGNDIATGMKLRHFRNNVELPWISVDKEYDSFFQSARIFDQPVPIDKTDVLSLECTYNSSFRRGVTKGGWSQVDELCRASLIYYPRLPFDQCLSWSSLDHLTSRTGELIPENMTMNYLEYVDRWDVDIKRRYKTALKLSTKKALCSSLKQIPNYALDRFVNPAGRHLRQYIEPESPCKQKKISKPLKRRDKDNKNKKMTI